MLMNRFSGCYESQSVNLCEMGKCKQDLPVELFIVWMMSVYLGKEVLKMSVAWSLFRCYLVYFSFLGDFPAFQLVACHIVLKRHIFVQRAA